MENLGQRRSSSKIRRGSKEDGAREVSPMDQGIQEETIGENANEEGVGLHNRYERRVCAEERKGVSVV